MSLKSKIEAVIYASEEPVTLAQLVGLLAEEAYAEVEELASHQAKLPLGITELADARPDTGRSTMDAGSDASSDSDAPLDKNSDAEVAVDARQTVSAGSERTHPDFEATPFAETNAPADEPSTNAIDQVEAANGMPESVKSEPLPAVPPADPEAEKRRVRDRDRAVREHLRRTVDALIRDYAESDRGIEIREVAGGFRMGTKPEYHDAVRGFVRSLKPAMKLSLQALETLAVVAYKQPITAAEISEIRGVDSAGVLGGLIARKLIATAGRKQVIGRPMLYKTAREFLVRFGLKDIHELPSMEEFERMAGELNEQEDLPMESTAAVIERANARGDADHIRETTGEEQPSLGEAVEGDPHPAEGTESVSTGEDAVSSGAPAQTQQTETPHETPEEANA